jgi:hypothetical protein
VIYPCEEGRYGMLSYILHCLCILPTGLGDGDVALELLLFFVIYSCKEGRYGMLSHILHCLCILPTGVGDGVMLPLNYYTSL